MNTPSRLQSVLVVEDESLVRMLAVDMFEEAGFHVLESTSGERALELLTSNTIVGLFTDVELAGHMTGLMLAELIRGGNPGAAIIVASGQSIPTAKALPPRARFIAKPYDLAEVIELFNALLILSQDSSQ